MVRKRIGILLKRELPLFAEIIPLHKRQPRERMPKTRKRKHLKAFLQNRTRARETEDWHRAIVEANAYLETLATDILAISQCWKIRTPMILINRNGSSARRNSISGLFAVSLAEGGRKADRIANRARRSPGCCCRPSTF